ncbi:MAG: hypothetical protein ACI35Q_03535 [Marinilabiliaceae bacterium]
MRNFRFAALAAAVLSILSSDALAQNVTKPAETGPAYIGASRFVRKFDGTTAISQDYSAFGICVGTYDDAPDVIVTELIVYTYSSGKWAEINANSKFILKVNGENMVLTTKYGTNWAGSHDTFVGSAGVLGALSGAKQVVYTAQARYPITGEQLEALMKYGFSKYRFQVVGGVNEDEFSERKQRRIAEDLTDAYNEVREEQAEIHRKVNDLSDF